MDKIIEFLKEDADRCLLGYEEINDKDYPVVACWRIDKAHVAFWCQDCDEIQEFEVADG